MAHSPYDVFTKPPRAGVQSECRRLSTRATLRSSAVSSGHPLVVSYSFDVVDSLTCVIGDVGEICCAYSLHAHIGLSNWICDLQSDFKKICEYCIDFSPK